MKTKNLLFSGAIALSTILSPAAALLNSTPVLAETVSNATDHAYKAYQIFSGSQSDDGTLGNIDWGSGVDKEALLADLKTKPAYANCNSAADVAGVVAKFGEDSAEARDFARTVNKHVTTPSKTIAAKQTSVDLDAGYYLLVDATEEITGDDVYGLSLLQLTKKGSVEIKSKTGKPSVEKKVEDEKDDNKANSDTEFVDSADHEIGETFKFQLTATIPNNKDMNEYKTYKVVFHDTLSGGLEFEQIVSVKVNGHDVTDYVLGGPNTDATTGETTFTLTIANVKKYLQGTETLADANVEVIYNAKLTSAAVVDNTEFKQNNKVKLEYSNNPNQEGEGEPDTGTTPEDYVFVGTYKLPNKKVDGTAEKVDGKQPALAGAEFKLKNNATGLWATFDSNKKLTGWVSNIDDATPLVSDANGDFSAYGLDAGTYTLKETVTPPGYNTAAEQTIVITAAHKKETTTTPKTADASLTLTIKNGDKDVTNGNEVENLKGSTLPETGGMGTTLIYTVGAALVGGAGILYVTNKRMRRED